MIYVCNDHLFSLFSLKAALHLGLSHAPLATAALDALESWSSLIPSAIMQPRYADILPHLDGYLKTTSNSGQLFVASPYLS